MNQEHILYKEINRIYYYWKRNNWILDPRSYWGKFRNISIEKPIFLLGVQCGGLTLVSRMLRRHPSVVSVTGNYHYWSGADEMHTVLGPVLPAELAGTRNKVPYSNHPVYRPPRSWTYACDELLPLYRKKAEDATPDLKQKFQRIIRMILSKYLVKEEPARFTDKSQVYTVRVSLINELLRESDPKFLLITMNPYVICYKAAGGKAADMERFKNKIPFKERLDICAQHWNNSIKCALEDKGENMLIMRFEDILDSSITKMKKICEFLELDFKRDILPQPHHKIPLGSKFQDRWYPLEPNRNRKYIQNIGEEEIEIVSKRCKKLASKLGYSIP